MFLVRSKRDRRTMTAMAPPRLCTAESNLCTAESNHHILLLLTVVTLRK
jgi:hypothetical protein